MMGLDEPKSARTAAREAFFLEFATAVRQRYPALVLMLTGGFRTRAGAQAAIAQGACDLIGIGRPAAVDPAFARLLLDESVADEEARLVLNKVPAPWYMKLVPVRAVGAGLESVCFRVAVWFPEGRANGCSRIMRSRSSGLPRG
jgi:2,4-dienoyl-CoA reductase-like NADH-dependent reductase (Old Yellow Enzyme family)